ncbi:APC family permease [Alloacidobacterium dinghuense]|uniref:APC family permease n=1 Tax=Alloacidobacterium dinghuense TaxID=2763107 RepID=A0A7G8BCF0_9BACT|nr:APC family permease [Alloacidobacterium dinghuense]QNI30220.1 APC family permease [Alloacidobacterium dinghuense]
MPVGQTFTAPQSNRVRLVVASSVMLTFISFWRAAAVVLNDLGSSAFYAGGIAEEAVGKAAPWFILGVMLFSFAVRAVYVESCSMFTRGGVYRVVKEALGGTFAKLSVSALMFDYILTGPISGVSAGQYITGLLNELMTVGAAHGWLPLALINAGHARQLPMNETSAVFCAAVTIYYWWQNIKGIEESTDKALEVMKITTVMVVLLLGWGIFSAIHVSAKLPPLPIPSNLHFSHDALGFLAGTKFATTLGLFGILMAFGHSVLAMSGEETLAQVNREIEHPKLKNLKRAAIVIAIYSFVFTGIVSLLAVMLIPDSVRVPVYRDNLIAGLAMYVVGPLTLKIVFRVFVVIVGFLILSGAINTSIIGSTGVLMRVAEDGVLTDWFRKPQRKYGTSYRIVNLVTAMQLFTIIVSRGNVITLGEAYAFGVIWSFTFNSLAMLVLRWKYKGERGWKVPINIKIGKAELPVGLFCVFLVLLSTAIVNLFTKSVATESGILFAAAFYTIFTVSEARNQRKHAATAKQMKEHFQLEHPETIGREALEIRPGGILVTMRDAANPFALKWALSRTNADDQDIVVLTARMMGAGGPEYIDASEQLFSEHEQMLFTKAVSVAESFGKHISLLVVPAGDIFAALVQTANSLEVTALVSGLSTKMTAQEQAYHVGQAWENLAEPKRQFTFYVVMPNGDAQGFHIGPHAPTLQADDVQLVHRLWLNFRRDPDMQGLHHSDIVTYALTRLAVEYARDKQETLRDIRRYRDGSNRGGTIESPLTPKSGKPGTDYSIPAPKPSSGPSDHET